MSKVEEIERLKKENTFLKSFLQCRTVRMDGRHTWRFRSGWLLDQVVGPSVDAAVANAMAAADKFQQTAGTE